MYGSNIRKARWALVISVAVVSTIVAACVSWVLAAFSVIPDAITL